MKILIAVLMLCGTVLAQVHAKVEIIDQYITKYVSQGKLISIDKQDKGKQAEKLTCLDDEFKLHVGSIPVDVSKSVAVAIKDAKFGVIEMVDEKGKVVKIDLAKEDPKSAAAFIEEMLKQGYKKVEKKSGK